MGCLNSNENFSHWFGNIHLSGPCNRCCYFCIGQHMMAQDGYNVLDKWPLDGMDEFMDRCFEHGVNTVYLTGTNTDPLLYRHQTNLVNKFRDVGFGVGIRTNGIAFNEDSWALYNTASVTICSLDTDISKRMMGGPPPDLQRIIAASDNHDVDLKINVVLGPENRAKLYELLNSLEDMGVDRVNLREPYGQPHQGNPFDGERCEMRLGMPVYKHGRLEVTYWDVHYVEVESVNLYASGCVSVTYPITKGCADDGVVQPQSEFTRSGRVRRQWVS